MSRWKDFSDKELLCLERAIALSIEDGTPKLRAELREELANRKPDDEVSA